MHSASNNGDEEEGGVAKKLKSIYYSVADPGAFSSVNKLWKRVRSFAGFSDTTRKQVVEFLENERAYTLHRPALKRYKRSKILVHDVDSQWQADLADLGSLFNKSNDGVRYLLTVIDCFSRYAWVVPIVNKTASELLKAFETLLSKQVANGRVPKSIQTDKGTEFFNSKVSRFFKQHNIHHFATQSDQKAAMVERFNRTLKERLARYMTANNTNRFIDVLQQHVDAYNASVHRVIGATPKDVSASGESARDKICRKMYQDYVSHVSNSSKASMKRGQKDQQLNPGDHVRLSKWKTTFEKGFTPNWTEEIFKVLRREPAHAKRRVGSIYKLVDWAGEPIDGQFYRKEVQKIKPGDHFLIDRVIQERTIRDPSSAKKKKCKGNKLSSTITQCLVHWLGWPDKYNSWINKDEVKELSAHRDDDRHQNDDVDE